MPSSSLSVPHFRQEHEYSCVAACARGSLSRLLKPEFGVGRLVRRSPSGSRMVEQLIVRVAAPGGLVDRGEVMAASSKLAADQARVQQAACRARATRSAASAVSSFRRIHSSISARCAS